MFRMKMKDLNPSKAVKNFSRGIKSLSRKKGLAPGTLVKPPVSPPNPVTARAFCFDAGTLEQKDYSQAWEGLECRDKLAVNWLDFDGAHDIELLGRIGDHLGMHPLLLENLNNNVQRPKLESDDSLIMVQLRMPVLGGGTDYGATELVSLILTGKNVISIQEKPGDVFDGVRKRLQVKEGRIRTRDAAYLFYALIDAVVDSYFEVLERVGDEIERMFDEVENPVHGLLPVRMHRLRTDMILLRKAVNPMRDVLSSLRRLDSPLLSPGLVPYLDDAHDHALHVVESTEIVRDLVASLRDTYMTAQSTRMNETMKVLTVIATVFIPITFVAGVYGMNFEIMPELKWAHGYFAALTLMAVVAVGMLIYFRRKGWF